MLRSPQMLASPGLREVHKSIFLLSKEAPWCACPRHQKWSGVEGERTASGRPSSLRKDEKCQDFAKQKTMHIRQIYPSPCSSALLKPGPSDGLTPCPHTLPTDLLPLSQASFSRCVVITRQNHCQNYSLKGLLNPVDNLHRSDLTCLQQISHDQAGQQKTGATLPTTIRSKRCSHSPLSFVSGSQELLFPRSVASSSQLFTCSSITVRPPQPPNHLSRLAVQSFRGMHTVAQLKVAPEYCLSTENEARCRKSLEQNVVVYQNDKGKSWAAVLVSLCTVGGEPAFLFTLRSSTLKGRHKGDVSFAGGKKDPADQDVVTTALREAREELGITVSPNQVWGVLKPLRDMSGMMIAPVLANLGPLEALSFRPNPSEVEEIFTITLAHVCSPDNQGYTHFRVGERYGYTLPVFRNGKHRVWGLTAVALDHTLKLILPP